MTTWGLIIIVAAIGLGLRRSITPRQQHAALVVAVFVAVAFAALRQHTY